MEKIKYKVNSLGTRMYITKEEATRITREGAKKLAALAKLS